MSTKIEDISTMTAAQVNCELELLLFGDDLKANSGASGAYRRKPRDLAGSADGFMLVESAMHARGYRFCAKHDSDGFYVNYIHIDKEVLCERRQFKDLPECNARAALAALQAEAK